MRDAIDRDLAAEQRRRDATQDASVRILEALSRDRRPGAADGLSDHAAGAWGAGRRR